MSDYYDGNNRAEDLQVKLSDKIDEWWNYLDESEQYELLEPYYPDKAQLMGTTEMWEGLSWEDKVDIYLEETDHESH